MLLLDSQSWGLIKDVFIVAITVAGGLLGNNIQMWLKRIYDQLKALNDQQIRHDERLNNHHERLNEHEKRISDLENK